MKSAPTREPNATVPSDPAVNPSEQKAERELASGYNSHATSTRPYRLERSGSRRLQTEEIPTPRTGDFDYPRAGVGDVVSCRSTCAEVRTGGARKLPTTD